MNYGYIKNQIENGEFDKYTDRVDVSIEISLFEYGILRNPKDNETILCQLYSNEEPDDDKEIKLSYRTIELDEIKEYLTEEAKDGFFSYIGSDRETELQNLDNDHLAHMITSINSYDGWFNY